MLRVQENPGIVERAAPNAHSRAAGFIDHVPGRFAGGYVSISNHRDVLDRLRYGANPGKIDPPGKALLPGASVNKDRCNSHTFQGARQLGGGDALIVPAESHFGSNGDFYRLDHSL